MKTVQDLINVTGGIEDSDSSTICVINGVPRKIGGTIVYKMREDLMDNIDNTDNIYNVNDTNPYISILGGKDNVKDNSDKIDNKDIIKYLVNKYKMDEDKDNALYKLNEKLGNNSIFQLDKPTIIDQIKTSIHSLPKDKIDTIGKVIINLNQQSEMNNESSSSNDIKKRLIQIEKQNTLITAALYDIIDNL